MKNNKISNTSSMGGGRELAVFGIILIFLSACTAPVIKSSDSQSASATTVTVSKPVSVQFNPATNGTEIQSYAADATVFQQNDRYPNAGRIVSKYRIRMKSIGGTLYTRLDFSGDDPMTAGRSVVTDGRESVIFETASLRVIDRSVLPNPVKPSAAMPSRIMGRIDVGELKNRLARLAYEIAEEKTGRYVECRAPASELASLRADLSAGTITEMRILLDMEDQVVAGTQQVQVLSDGETVTTECGLEYQEVNNEPVLIGQVIQEHHDVPGALPEGPDVLPKVIDPDTIPEVSAEELAAMSRSGLVARIDPPVGDRTDPDYTMTTITSFDNVRLNDTADSDLRIFFTEAAK